MNGLFDLNDLNIKQGIFSRLFSDDEIIESAFNEFRERGFPYPEMTIAEMKIQLNKLRALPISKCKHSVIGYKIADMFNKHRFEAIATEKRSPVESFFNDVALKKALNMTLKSNVDLDYSYKEFMSIVNGTQACSNFRPAFAKFVYTKYCTKNGKIFDPSFGYGGRLVGFLASCCNEYVGTDPNTLSFAANKKMCNILNKDKKIKLFNLPIEDFDENKYLNYFDLSFTSPPYFKKEIYSNEKTQSCNRYPNYEDWVECFLYPFFMKQYFMLKLNGFCVTNIEDVKINSKTYNLVDTSIEIAKNIGFSFITKDFFNLQAPRRKKDTDGNFFYEKAKETILIFKKERY